MPPDPIQFFASVQAAVHRVRPTDPRDGAAMVRDAMALVANDGCQRADTSEDSEGYVVDARSVRTLRVLLAALYPRVSTERAA